MLRRNDLIFSISIHSLRMEGDLIYLATHRVSNYFNPLPPHGGRRSSDQGWMAIHRFQSTPSAWRETWVLASCRLDFFISIHSLRMEGDFPRKSSGILTIYFNPLPPHGGRRAGVTSYTIPTDFNPLPPHGGRLPVVCVVSLGTIISIHSLRMEGDP